VILADTSVWIDFFRKPDKHVQDLARQRRICGHPFVTGELAAGSLHVRHRMVLMLRNLPQLQPVEDSAFYAFLEKHEVNGKGMGFVDIHLLAAASEAGNVQVWTRDRRMLEQATHLGLAYRP
jgi:predicted nucleic acid-binding protein